MTLTINPLPGDSHPSSVIRLLSSVLLPLVRCWFLEKDWERWDRQIVEDSRAGKLDFLIKEAFDAKKEKTLREL